jgi:hypothetical protein
VEIFLQGRDVSSVVGAHLACARPWVQSPTLKKERKKGKRRNLFCIDV